MTIPPRKSAGVRHEANASSWTSCVPPLAALVLAVAPIATLAQSAPVEPGPTTKEDGTLVLSPFEVSTRTDKGYRASNSVSGSRFDTAIKDLPFALQAFTQDFISDVHPSTLYDVAMYSPGVTYRSTDFTDGNAQLGIRGFNVAQSNLYNSQTLRDGMRGPPIIDFSNVERMEIVKGPASFLYGQLAPGGMVNVITKSPKERFQGEVDAGLGSYGEYNGMLDVTGPLGGGVFYRFVTAGSHDMNYWKPYDSNQTDFAPQFLYKASDSVSLAVKFEQFHKRETPQLFAKPTWGGTRSGLPTDFAKQADPLFANAVLPAGLPSWVTDMGNDPNLAGVFIPGVPSNFNQMADSDFRDSKDTNVSTTLDVKANDHWSGRIAYGLDRNIIDMTFSGRPIANPNVNAYTAAYNAAIAAGQTPVQAAAAAFPNSGFAMPRRWRWQTTRRVSDSLEGQALGKYNFGETVSLKLLLGAIYNPYSARQRNAQAPDSTNPVYNPTGPFPPWDLRDPSTWNRTVSSTIANRDNISRGGNGLPQENNDITRVNDQSVYAGATWGFLKDRLLVITGSRYTRTTLQTEHDFATIPSTPPVIGRTIDPEFSASKNTPQIGALYKIRPDVSVFASYSKSFVPAAGTLAVIDKTDPNNWTTVAGAAIRPTEGKGYDIGVKTDLFNGRVSSTLTYFDVKNDNILVSVPTTGPVTTGGVTSTAIFFPSFQSGRQESKGFEADLTYSPIDNWQLYASASIMNARDDYWISPADDARYLAINTLAGYQALSSADQSNWRNVWNNHGKPLQMTSPHSYNVWMKYTFDRGAIKGLFVGGGANFIQKMTIFPQMDPRFRETYALVNMIAGYGTKVDGYPVTVTLNGKNLTNKEYLPSQNSRSRPREFVFTVSTKF